MPKSRYRQVEFDKTQMYFGEPYVIDQESAQGTVTVYQPTIGDIMRIGEKKFYTSLNLFITNTTSYRLPLWQGGIDWNEISDYDLFLMLYAGADPEVVKMIFGELDFSKFKLYEKNTDEKSERILWNQEDGVEINEDVYWCITQYLRNVFNIFPEEKITHDSIMKQWLIRKSENELANAEIRRKKGLEEKDSSMITVISACVNHPGFKYNLKELKDVGVCQFYDSVKRLQVYENTTALLKGMYSGMISAKDLDPNSYNFMKEI